MWKEFDGDGFLVYKNFLETVVQILPMYWMRALGGTLYIIGVFVMIYNLILTSRKGEFLANEEVEAAPLPKEEKSEKKEYWHKRIERKPAQMLFWALILILIGGIVEMVPTFMVQSNVPTIASVQPYTPLELEGRDLYIREGCYTCHSQMVRPFRSESERYGEYSKAGEFVYDHPFQWGSKRTGPDLAREGTPKLKKSDAWHYQHMLDPRILSPGSIMPSYEWLIENRLDLSMTADKIEAMQTLGVPYPEGYAAKATDDLQQQAEEIANNIATELEEDELKALKDREIVAIIAYLQRLGTDIMVDNKK